MPMQSRRTGEPSRGDRGRRHSSAATRAETTIETSNASRRRLTAKRTRLEQQLKIVTETRQAEALKHEIETLNEHRDELDDRELEALEQQAEGRASDSPDSLPAKMPSWRSRSRRARSSQRPRATGADEEADLRGEIRRSASRSAERRRGSRCTSAVRQHGGDRYRPAGRPEVRWLPPRPLARRAGRGEGAPGRRARRMPAVRAHPGPLTSTCSSGSSARPL